jgi:hypothetical protein
MFRAGVAAHMMFAMFVTAEREFPCLGRIYLPDAGRISGELRQNVHRLLSGVGRLAPGIDRSPVGNNNWILLMATLR